MAIIKSQIDPASPELIVTVWGVGYKLDLTPSAVSSSAAAAQRMEPNSNVTSLRR